MDQIVDPQFLQRQHDVGHFRPQNLGIRRLLQILVITLLGVQPEALSRPGTPGASRSLPRRSAGYGRYQQRFDPNAGIVHLLLGETGIDDVHDPVDRQRRLGHIGRYHHLPSGRSSHDARTRSPIENLALLLGGQRRIQRIYHELRGILPHLRRRAAQFLARLFDLLLSRQKDQNVAGTLALMDLQRGAYGRLDVIPLRLGRVEYLHGEGASGYLEEGRAVKVLLEFFGVERRGHDHHLELSRLGPLRPPPQYLHEQTHNDIGGEGTLVRLVQYNHRISTQQRIAHGLPQ
mmetsp:Transcript_20640/g.59944  ORF Transcript_20640/g.59944 Transcript_20640/m.59944 type:complete len:290 (+) Transcript_20640:1030-1899(+)